MAHQNQEQDRYVVVATGNGYAVVERATAKTLREFTSHDIAGKGADYLNRGGDLADFDRQGDQAEDLYGSGDPV